MSDELKVQLISGAKLIRLVDVNNQGVKRNEKQTAEQKAEENRYQEELRSIEAEIDQLRQELAKAQADEKTARDQLEKDVGVHDVERRELRNKLAEIEKDDRSI